MRERAQEAKAAGRRGSRADKADGESKLRDYRHVVERALDLRPPRRPRACCAPPPRRR